MPRLAVALVAAAAAGLAGCGDDDTVEGPPPVAPARIQVSSEAFAAGAAIPRRFTCDGDDSSPPLAWSGVPAGARSLALLVEDPDAPGGTYVHWTLFDVAPATRGLRAGEVPSGASEGEGSSGERGYHGPCPPKGDDPHRYRFIVYALRSPLGLDAGAAPDEVRAAIGERALARGELVGRYGR